jgi:hypothetical protein
MKRIEIAAIRKAEDAEIRVAVTEYKGRPVLDIRVWYLPRDKRPGSEWFPTRKGVTFDLEKLPDMTAALVEAERLMRD